MVTPTTPLIDRGATILSSLPSLKISKSIPLWFALSIQSLKRFLILCTVEDIFRRIRRPLLRFVDVDDCELLEAVVGSDSGGLTTGADVFD